MALLLLLLLQLLRSLLIPWWSDQPQTWWPVCVAGELSSWSTCVRLWDIISQLPAASSQCLARLIIAG
jgi:hypothetical protein